MCVARAEGRMQSGHLCLGQHGGMRSACSLYPFACAFIPDGYDSLRVMAPFEKQRHKKH